MNRRHFALTGVAAAFARRFALPAPRTLRRIGLELYSVRGAMQHNPERTLAEIRAIGYTDVELLWSFGNFGRTVPQVRATLEAEGLKAPSAHIATSTVTGDWARALDDARTLGHEMLILPGLPAESRRSLDVWREWADRLNAAGEQARSAGVWLGFHNEPDHQRPIDGQIPYDVFIERLDPRHVRLQLDVGNLTMGGGDPLQYLRRFRDRYWSFHIKDVVPDRSRDTALGAGRVDLKAILEAIPEIDRKPCIVEQEGAANDTLAARADFGYLSRLSFQPYEG